MNKIPLRSLIIEDNEDDVLMLVRHLQKIGYEPDYTTLDREEDLQQALANSPGEWQMIFADYTMPSFSGLAALQIVRQQDQDVPFIFVSGTMGEDKAVETIRMGAQDYIVKGNLERLSVAVPRELASAQDRILRKDVEARLRFNSLFDSLTGLPNYAHFVSLLDKAIKKAAQQDTMVGVITVQVDRYQETVDNFGVEAGNELLRQVTRGLKERMRNGVVVARIPRDEFAIIVPDVEFQSELVEKVKKISTYTSEPIKLWGYDIDISSSIGVSIYPLHGDSIDTLYQNANLTMRKVSKAGGKSFKFFSSAIAREAQERLNIENDLRSAINRQDFSLYFQPQVDILTGRVHCLETFLRWNRKGHGELLPEQFIHVAEETGLILPLGEWLLKEALRQFKHWRVAYGAVLDARIAVKLSAYQLRQKNLCGWIEKVLREVGLESSCLVLEIADDSMAQNPNMVCEAMNKLHQLGISVCLDNFGTGKFTFNSFRNTQIDTIKLDPQFIREVPGNLIDTALVQSMLSLASNLNIAAVIKGVETAEQLNFVRNQGCQLVQGYYFQQPLPAEDMGAILTAHKPYAARLF
ncbi:MAG: EAL domain-containing protein [Gammaproteobacteria bacterium]|uniref:EAL domain-containing response regulator n=1 Tax=Pseudomaricurvus alcaniphilus TaxID=1166482 RepID=UPI001408978B|nr:EAL domain-containing response regulator [Pseudomaricurvus alcaniphilus]MBR9913112.1 EAL domain-containing protein [Gammaproteobacteria bacterium]NHN36265.1 EAL domain-containing protein [Pseudomaricurvus alcaniphilus]